MEQKRTNSPALEDVAGEGGLREEHKSLLSSFFVEVWEGPEFVVFGHDAKRELQVYPYAIGLDTVRADTFLDPAVTACVCKIPLELEFIQCAIRLE